jgi:pilus assembly protein Flp/PilA
VWIELARADKALRTLWRREDGVTAIEYGLLAALIAIAIVTGLNSTSESMINMYDRWSTAVVNAISS